MTLRDVVVGDRLQLMGLLVTYLKGLLAPPRQNNKNPMLQQRNDNDHREIESSAAITSTISTAEARI